MASYSYKCSSCGKSFQAMKIMSSCIYCGKNNISQISAGVSESRNSGRITTIPSDTSNSKYVMECNACHYKEETTTINSNCSRCNSSSVKATTSNNSVQHSYTCSTCNNEFSTLSESSSCTRCFSTNIYEKTSSSNSNNSYTCNSCNYSFNSVEATHTCTRCSSSNISSGSSLYGNTGINARMAMETDSTTPGYSTNDSQNNGNIYDGGGALDSTNGTTNNTTSSDTNDSSNNDNGSSGGFFSTIGGIVSGLVENVSEFFSSFYTTEDDEKSFINSFLQTSSGDLSNSTYGGPYATYDDGTNVNDEMLVKNLQDMEDTSGSIIENVNMDDDIFGLPLYYNAFADPAKSVFNNSILYDAPLVSFIPGKPKVNRKLIDATGSKVVDLDEYYDKTSGDTENPDFNIGVLNPKNWDDMRYLSFKPNYTEYWKYVQFLTSYVHNWMVATDSESWQFEKYNFKTELKNKYSDTYGLLFYADRSTTVSENASNSYSTSRVAEMVNEKSSTTREASMLGKYNNFTEFATNLSQNISGWMEGTMSSIESLKSFEGVLTKSANSLMKVVNGAQLDFPEMWQDSKFDRSYSVSFRFYSPYGDRASIERYVYTPFLALLALTLSRQDQAFSYVEPFLVRVDAPGWNWPLHAVMYVE